MKSCLVSRVLRVGTLACALAVAWSAPNVLAQKWDHGVPDNLFQDGKTEGKNPRPTRRLTSTKCDDCQAIVDQLQAALDDWYVMQLGEGKGMTIDHSDMSEAGSEKQKTKNKLTDDAMAGLGQPNAKDLDAKQKQQKKDAKDKKDTHGSKDALAKEIQRLSDALVACLKKCPPKEEPGVTEPGGGTTPTGGGGGKTGGGGEEPGTGEKPGGGVGAPPGEEVLPTLPKCWPDKASKEKFYKDLKGVDEELQSDVEMSDHFDPKRKSQGAVKILGKMKEAKALREAAEKIKDCPPPEKTPSGKTALPGGTGDNCAFLVHEGKIKIDNKGTGETIGHVVDLIIENLTDQPLVCVVPPMVLESGSGKNQHYACLESHTVTIDPHGKVTVPINGVCIARNKPPVGKGVPGDLLINDGNPTIAQNPNAHISTKDSGELLRLCSSKYKAAEKLQKDGAFKDFPYHDKQKQLDIVVQWLVWSDPRICEIAGAPPAKKEDFKKVIYKQVEEHGPMTPDTKKKIDKGADTMWDGIELAGAKAKDLEPEQTPMPYGGPSILDQPQTVGMPTPTPGAKTTERPTATPATPLPTTTERPATPTASVPQTEGKPTPTPTPTPATATAKTGGKYPFTKETDCGTITISVGESGELVFDFKPKNDPKCPCKEFGWIQHISNADNEVWRYDNGVLAAVGKRTGAKSDPDKPNQPTTPPKGTKLEDWDNNPWYGGTTDRSKPEDFGEHPTPQTHVSDKPDAPGIKFKMQLVCVTTGQVLFTWEWGPLANGQQSVDKAPGKSVSPP